MNKTPEYKIIKKTKKILITVVGLTLIIIGIAMIVLPGPALLVIPLGLAILASDYIWARRLMKKIKNKLGLQKEQNK